MRFKPITYFLIASAFFAVCILDWYPLGNRIIWDVFAGVTIIFSLLAIFHGVRFIKNKKRAGLLFVYDLTAIIGSTLLFIVTSFFVLLFILLSIGGLPRE